MSETIIVVPCYNEAERLDVDPFVGAALSEAGHHFLLVDDGSTDATREVLDDLAAVDAHRFSVLGLQRNGGKAEAVRQGVLAALDRRPRYVGYWDADLATPLEAIDTFQDVLEQHPQIELVMGARVRMLGRAIERQPLRHLLGRGFATVASRLLQLPVYDTQCGAKLFRADGAVRQLFQDPFLTNWVFDVELLARLVRARRQAGLGPAAGVLYEVPLDHWRDVAGSKVRPRDFLKAAGELWRIRTAYLRDLPARQPESADGPTARPAPNVTSDASPQRPRRELQKPHEAAVTRPS